MNNAMNTEMYANSADEMAVYTIYRLNKLEQRFNNLTERTAKSVKQVERDVAALRTEIQTNKRQSEATLLAQQTEVQKAVTQMQRDLALMKESLQQRVRPRKVPTRQAHSPAYLRRQELLSLLELGPVSVEYYSRKHNLSSRQFDQDLNWVRNHGLVPSLYRSWGGTFIELM